MTMRISNKHELVLDFIGQFSAYGEAVNDCFSNGMCYYFAQILQQRFFGSAKIVYDPVINHFATEIDGRVYDINGDITNEPYLWYDWSTYRFQDSLETKRIIRDCIRKIPSDVRVCEFCDLVHEDDWGNISCSIDRRPREAYTVCDLTRNRIPEDNNA